MIAALVMVARKRISRKLIGFIVDLFQPIEYLIDICDTGETF